MSSTRAKRKRFTTHGRNKLRFAPMLDSGPVTPQHFEANAKSCRNKVYYKTEAQARDRARHHGLRHYPCGVCGGFHLTSKPKSEWY